MSNINPKELALDNCIKYKSGSIATVHNPYTKGTKKYFEYLQTCRNFVSKREFTQAVLFEDNLEYNVDMGNTFKVDRHTEFINRVKTNLNIIKSSKLSNFIYENGRAIEQAKVI